MHLVFYDGQCGFCDRVVQLILKADKKKIFLFAPLQGQTAAEVLKDLPEEYKTLDTLILIENYSTSAQQLYVLGQASFRILWLLGLPWSIFGVVGYLPSILYNWGYRLVAANRHRFFSESECILPDPKERNRFLP